MFAYCCILFFSLSPCTDHLHSNPKNHVLQNILDPEKTCTPLSEIQSRAGPHSRSPHPSPSAIRLSFIKLDRQMREITHSTPAGSNIPAEPDCCQNSTFKLF